MLLHISDTLPPMLHLPVSPDDTLHFYRYLHTHILIENKQFLLLIDVPIQDRSCQITIHKVLTLSIPHGNFSACYDINTKYLGISKDATMVVELPTTQVQVCQEANGQFCSITTPFQPLANPIMCLCSICKEPIRCYFPMFITNKENFRCRLTNTDISDVWILMTPLSAPANTIMLICPEKATETITVRRPVFILRLPATCNATSPNFYLPLRYKTSNLDGNVSLNMANLCMINISALDFCIWQHLRNNGSEIQLWHLTTIPLIPVHKIYQHIINGTQHIIPFNTNDVSIEDTDSIWTLFLHTGMYVTAIGLLIPAGLGLFCCFGVNLPD